MLLKNRTIPPKTFFTFGLIFLCFIFLVMQLYLSAHLMFSPDELWVAHSVYSKYRVSLPYRDFAPYKTVLGYYFFIIPLSLTQDPVTGLIYLKIFLTIINTALLFICSLWFTRYFSYTGILISLGLLISTSFFMNFAMEIRVDLLAYWCCLLSVLLLLDKRFVYAGFLLGLAFCISQKAIWYGLASNFALSVVWLAYQRNRKDLISILFFNLIFMTVVACYLCTWIWMSNLQTVIDNVFYQAAVVYKINLYQTSQFYMLGYVIKPNFFYLVFWPFSILTLLIKTPNMDLSRRIFILIFAWTAMFCLFVYKQPFLYYTIAVLPPLFLLYTDFFTWLSNLLTQKITFVIDGRFLIYLFVVLTIYLFFVKIEFVILPSALIWCSVALVLCAPIFIYFYIKKIKTTASLANIYLIVLVAGIIIPQIDNAQLFVQSGYQYQQLAMRLVNKLVQDGSTYIAGVDFLYNKNQIISGNSFLEQNILFLDQPNRKLEELMLPALDLSPRASIENMITAINENPVKVFIHFPWLDRLPQFLAYLKTQYSYLWGNIYVYSPQIAKGSHVVNIKFPGEYLLDSEMPIFLNGKKIMPHARLALKAQSYPSVADHTYRLTLQTNEQEPLPKRYYAETPLRLVVECTVIYVNNQRRCVYFQFVETNQQENST